MYIYIYITFSYNITVCYTIVYHSPPAEVPGPLGVATQAANLPAEHTGSACSSRQRRTSETRGARLYRTRREMAPVSLRVSAPVCSIVKAKARMSNV